MDFRIKELCKEKGVLFKDLAKNIGVSDIGLRQSLKGNPTIGTLEKIASALGVPITSLFEAERDFIAFVRRNGETFTFESEKALKEYASTLPDAE